MRWCEESSLTFLVDRVKRKLLDGCLYSYIFASRQHSISECITHATHSSTFLHFNYSHFGFIVQTNRHTDATKRFTIATVIGMSNKEDVCDCMYFFHIDLLAIGCIV